MLLGVLRRFDTLAVMVEQFSLSDMAALLFCVRLSVYIRRETGELLTLTLRIIKRTNGVLRCLCELYVEYADLVPEFAYHPPYRAGRRASIAHLSPADTPLHRTSTVGVGRRLSLMASSLNLDDLNYEPCTDDPGWVRCRYCWSKVYVGRGEKLVDLARHEERCEWR